MRYVLGRVFSTALFGLLLFAAAGRLDWPRAWVYLGVVSSGPYRIVRHPGYLAAIVGSLAAPLILGSLWAFAPVVAGALLFTARTALEDRTLRQELAGYPEYASRTRFRLLPGIW